MIESYSTLKGDPYDRLEVKVLGYGAWAFDTSPIIELIEPSSFLATQTPSVMRQCRDLASGTSPRSGHDIGTTINKQTTLQSGIQPFQGP